MPVIDPETGLPNEQVLTDVQIRSQEALARAQRAEQSIAEFQRNQRNQVLYTAYPELNPEGEKFNKDLHVEVRKVFLDSMLNPDDYNGKQLSELEAVDLARKRLGGSDEMKKQVAQETLDSLTPKEQASLAVGGNSGRRANMVDSNELRKISRGKDIKARLARIERFEKIMQE